MALAQFELDYKRLMTRFKQPINKVTMKGFTKMDTIGKRIATKGISPKEREEQVNKLRDAMKKLRTAIKADIKERIEDFQEAKKKKEKGFDEMAASRTMVNVNREMNILQTKAAKYAELGGAAPPPPKLPEFHFGVDYNKIVVEHDGTLSPAVVSVLDKLDENADAGRAVQLMTAAREALKNQTTPLAALASQARDPKEKARLNALVKDLTEFRAAIKQLEMKIFLIHRLKD